MSPSPHATLTRAGWRYDPAQDRYQAPDSDPATGIWYNLAAALAAHRRAQPATPDPAAPKLRDARRSDPR